MGVGLNTITIVNQTGEISNSSGVGGRGRERLVNAIRLGIVKKIKTIKRFQGGRGTRRGREGRGLREGDSWEGTKGQGRRLS